MAKTALNPWSPWMQALLASDDTPTPEQQAAATPAQPSTAQPPAHRIEDDRTAGTRGTTPQSPTTSAIQGSIDKGQVTALADRVQPKPNPLESRVAENKAALERLGTAEQPQSLGDTMLPGGGVGRGIGRFLINATAGGVGQTRRDQAFKNTLAQRTALQQSTEQDVRQLSQQQEAEARLREQEEMRQNLADRTNQTRLAITGEQIAGRAAEGQANRESRESIAGQAQQDAMTKYRGTQDYLRWKTQQDNATKLEIAKLRNQAVQNKAPAALMQTAVFAQGGIKSLNDAQAAMAKLETAGVMGQSWAQNKVEDWVFGKGAVDPSVPPDIRKTIGELRQALNLSASAMTRAHTQRGSKEVYDDLKRSLGPGQDWSALRGAIEESQDMLGLYVSAASNQSIANIRGGGGGPAAPTPTGGGQQATHKIVGGKVVPIGRQP